MNGRHSWWVGVLLGLVCDQAAAHGPGKRLDLDLSFCGQRQDVLVLEDARAGGNYPLCLELNNDEEVVLELSFSLVPGVITDQGKAACRIPLQPEKGEAWLAEGGEAYRAEIPAQGIWRRTVTLHLSNLRDYPAHGEGNPAWRGWLGCLLVEGRALGVSGHKNARLLRMIRVESGKALP